MTSTLLANHLEQIQLCASSISDLEFAGPKSFTTALLKTNDITALIRDTEIHEQALFQLAPPSATSKPSTASFSSSTSGPPTAASRQSLAPTAVRQPRKNTAVAAVLGSDFYRKLKSAGTGTDATSGYAGSKAADKNELNVDLLLEGAERLCNVYPISGSMEQITKLRQRYQQLSANIAHYENRVARNTTQLGMMSTKKPYDDLDETPTQPFEPSVPMQEPLRMTREDLVREEEEIRELEGRKRGLEDRVAGMEKDLGGLMR